jgi:hypothetical protein
VQRHLVLVVRIDSFHDVDFACVRPLEVGAEQPERGPDLPSWVGGTHVKVPEHTNGTAVGHVDEVRYNEGAYSVCVLRGDSDLVKRVVSSESTYKKDLPTEGR